MKKLILKDFSCVSYDEERDIKRCEINANYRVKLYIGGEVIQWTREDFFSDYPSDEIAYAEIGCTNEKFKKIDGCWERQIIDKFKGFQHITLGLNLSKDEIIQKLNNAFNYRMRNKPYEYHRYDFPTLEAYEKYLEKYNNYLTTYLTTYSYPCTISFYKDYEKAFSSVNSKGYHTGRLKKRRAERWEYERRKVCDVEIEYKGEDPIYISESLDKIYIHLVELFINNTVLSPRSYEETGIYTESQKYWGMSNQEMNDYIKEANEAFAREMDEHNAWGNID